MDTTKQDAPDQKPAADTVKTTTEVPVNPTPPPTTPTTDVPAGAPAKAQGDGAGE